ncbi:hypothetical protein KKF82_04405 [Patescibacteria group bacterium]|nr:hypothetical protein [Patescibacteria group bacterium]
MLEIFVILQVEAAESRRLAEYYSEGSPARLNYIKHAEELEAKVVLGNQTVREIFGHYGQYPAEQCPKRKSCQCVEEEKLEACECEPNGCKSGCHC